MNERLAMILMGDLMVSLTIHLSIRALAILCRFSLLELQAECRRMAWVMYKARSMEKILYERRLQDDTAYFHYQ